MFPFLYPTLLIACVLFVVWKGQSDERTILAALVVGSVTTAAIHARREGNWLDPSLMMFANELIVTAVILVVAFRSKKLWPLPVASFQLIALLAQIVNLFGENLQSHVVGVTQGVWAYLQLTVLLFAAWANMKNMPAKSI